MPVTTLAPVSRCLFDCAQDQDITPGDWQDLGKEDFEDVEEKNDFRLKDERLRYRSTNRCPCYTHTHSAYRRGTPRRLPLSLRGTGTSVARFALCEQSLGYIFLAACE